MSIIIEGARKSTWRDDPGLSSVSCYRKKFAFFPKRCTDSTLVWFKYYYTKYEIWSHGQKPGSYDDSEYSHTDKVEDITEAEYIVRKLAERL
jgi:hypothetical protein